MAFSFIKWEETPEIEGVYAGQLKGVGTFKANVFVFKIGEKNMHAWSSVGLQMVFHGVPFKVKFRLKYSGKKKMPDSDRMYNHFEIEILDDSATGYKKLPEL